MRVDASLTAGKSTLMNSLCRAKVSITSRKAQTTLEEAVGVMTVVGQSRFVDIAGD